MTTEDWFDEALEDIELNSEENRWEPEAGEILKGVFLKTEIATTDYGKRFVVFVRNLDTGETVSWGAFRTVAHRQLVDTMPAPGSLMVIKYFGEVEPKKEGGRPYHNYQIRAQKSDPEHWAPLLLEQSRLPDHQRVVPAPGDQLDAPF